MRAKSCWLVRSSRSTSSMVPPWRCRTTHRASRHWTLTGVWWTLDKFPQQLRPPPRPKSLPVLEAGTRYLPVNSYLVPPPRARLQPRSSLSFIPRGPPKECAAVPWYPYRSALPCLSGNMGGTCPQPKAPPPPRSLLRRPAPLAGLLPKAASLPAIGTLATPAASCRERVSHMIAEITAITSHSA